MNSRDVIMDGKEIVDTAMILANRCMSLDFNFVFS